MSNLVVLSFQRSDEPRWMAKGVKRRTKELACVVNFAVFLFHSSLWLLSSFFVATEISRSLYTSLCNLHIYTYIIYGLCHWNLWDTDSIAANE